MYIYIICTTCISLTKVEKISRDIKKIFKITLKNCNTVLQTPKALCKNQVGVKTVAAHSL